MYSIQASYETLQPDMPAEIQSQSLRGAKLMKALGGETETAQKQVGK